MIFAFFYIYVYTFWPLNPLFIGLRGYNNDRAYKKYKYIRITIHNNIYKQTFCPLVKF